MVRISIPPRLRPSSRTNSTNIIRSSSSSPAPTMAKSTAADTSPGSSKPSGLVLKIVVLKGRELAPKDKSGTSDPYLVLTLGDSKFVTPAIPKTLNPEWNIICELPVSGVDSLVFDCVCWDKDRFGKDYMGEFDLALEEIFTNDSTQQEPKWFPLKSKRPGGKKSSTVSGAIQLQFTIYDAADTEAPHKQVLDKLWSIAGIEPESIPSSKLGTSALLAGQDGTEEEELDEDEEPSDESVEDLTKPGATEKKKRRLRIKGLKKRQKQQRSYEFSGAGSDLVGIVFLEIGRIKDLPPERNMTRTSFDMDPFVVASLGKKTYRTRVVRHNLNPVFNEKMIFQVLRHEQAYSLSFTVIDRDMMTGNDFIASCSIPLQEIAATAPKPDPETGLYDLKEPTSVSAPQQSTNRSRFRLPLSRSSSANSLSKMGRPSLTPRTSATAISPPTEGLPVAAPTSAPSGTLTPTPNVGPEGDGMFDERGDPDVCQFVQPLKLKNQEKWEEKHSPELLIKAKYVPYTALRQQFWRAMLKQYDTDESGQMSKVELTTMLDTLGSTLKESTIDGFFKRFPQTTTGDETNGSLTIDQAIICLEDELYAKKSGPTVGEKIKNLVPDSETVKNLMPTQLGGNDTTTTESEPTTSTSGTTTTTASETTTLNDPDAVSESQLTPPVGDTAAEEGEYLGKDDLNDRGEEHVVVIRECPICHQPRLNRRSDADIITHVATCASQDWRQINNIVMAGFVTSSQAQRKWYSKVITKISYGGYKLGANSANILVQDRITGQINEERMSVYVRLGIRLLYKGLKSRDMENKRIRKLLKSLSVKQGYKYDDPASKAEIQKFIDFHQLDMSEVLLPMEEFKNFNEFFYRALKPEARPCSAPDNPHIVVSPADCRTVVFNKVDDATRIWIKGREFSIQRLLGKAYPEDAKRYVGGALGIFRLAPQDYHRFHVPVDGVMGTPKLIEGEYYTVNPMAIRSALDVYGENVRVCVPIDSTVHGRVMAICVGAMMVGSTVITRQPGEKVGRAEELGYFKFGGSTVILLFEPGVLAFDDDLVENSNSAVETLIRVGMSIGHSPQAAQHTPDMRKADADITESEKADAKRRIEGSVDLGRRSAPKASMAG